VQVSASGGKSDSSRLLIVGWDGADWEILDDLMSRGLMPNLAALIDSGARGVLESTIPSHSWAAWSTFQTGLQPGRHGVFDFVERDPHQPRRRIPVSSGSIKAPTFFERLSEAGHEVRAANIPVTFPARQVLGRVIAGVAIPSGASFVYPEEWAKELEATAPFPPNGMEWVRFERAPEGLVGEVVDLIERRTRSFEQVLTGDWRVATCVYLAPDRLQHPFGSHLLPSHPCYEDVCDTPLAESIRAVYGLLDEHLQRLRVAAGPDSTLVVMSDHGFRPITKTWNLGAVLNLLGFAPSRRTAEATSTMLRSSLVRNFAKNRLGRRIKARLKAPSEIDWSKTVAYQSALGFGVSVNLRGREPDGIVAPSDYEARRDEVREALLHFRDPVTGESPVGAVFRREELYDGPYMELAPDLIVGSDSLWAFERMNNPTATTKWPSGAHRRAGIMVAVGDGVIRSDLGSRNIADLAATALAFCGVSAAGLDGKPVGQILGSSADLLPSGDEVEVPVETAMRVRLSREDEESIARHLRSLGYIE